LFQLEVIFLALAVSLDGFGVGLACGIRRLFILPSSLLVICLMSAGAVAISMVLGKVLGVFISPELAPRGGGIILLFMGLYFTVGAIKELFYQKAQKIKDPVNQESKENSGIAGWSRLTKDPREADRDFSGTLSAREVLGLGAALGADAFGAGFGAVLVGLNPVLTVIAVGLTKLLLVPAGLFLGKWFSFGFMGDLAPLLSGLMLLFLGFSALL